MNFSLVRPALFLALASAMLAAPPPSAQGARAAPPAGARGRPPAGPKGAPPPAEPAASALPAESDEAQSPEAIGHWARGVLAGAPAERADAALTDGARPACAQPTD